MLSGRTKNLGVIGCPIAHSLSPAMQSAAIESAKADYAYIAMPVAPEELAAAVAGLRSLGFCGFNVTIPHKSTIIPLLDEIDEDARRIGAVNTVVREGARLKGYNTDAAGFLRPLSERGFSIAGKRAFVFGAGGAARAVLWSLSKSGAASITVSAKDTAKASAAIDSFLPEAGILVTGWESNEAKDALSRADIVVNTTPLGMTPDIGASPVADWTLVPREALVYDIVYTPSATRFIREAKRRGNETINGVPMLVGQGAAAFRLWTGIEPDFEVMRAALESALSAKI